ETLGNLPDALRALLAEPTDEGRPFSGFIQFHGGLHTRGACLGPPWHSLGEAWRGETAISRLFPEVGESDVPFAQDYLGNQFLYRNGFVLKLSAELGRLENPLPGVIAVQ